MFTSVSHPHLQYAILMTMVLTIFIKYVLHSVDLQSENPWDNKAVYMLYTELFTGERILDFLFISHAYHSVDPHQHPLVCLPAPWPAAALLSSSGFIKVLLYMAFMTIMIKVHTFPLFAIRPMYLAMR